jgi:hypothetical protein
MRKIIVQEFMTLDGVIQAPGGPEEDRSSDFKDGGWVASYFYDADEVLDTIMQKWMQSTEILLGKTPLRFGNLTGQSMLRCGRELMMSLSRSCLILWITRTGKILSF